MPSRPEDSVRFGDRYVFPGGVRYPAQTVTLTATPGPVLPMWWGLLAIADPGHVDDRALMENMVTMDVDGGVAAAVFLCGDGPGLFRVYEGSGSDVSAVAVTIDLRLLDVADRSA